MVKDTQGPDPGEQERLLLRARPDYGRVHLGPTILTNHLGQGDRSKDRTAHHQHRSEVRQGSDAGIARWRRRPNWSPMSYNPQTGLVYIPSRDGTRILFDGLRFQTGPLACGRFWQSGLKPIRREYPGSPAGTAIGPEPLPGGNVSTLVAYDPVKQEIRWRVPVGNSRLAER